MGLKVHQNLDTGPGTGSVIKNNVIMQKKKKNHMAAGFAEKACSQKKTGKASRGLRPPPGHGHKALRKQETPGVRPPRAPAALPAARLRSSGQERWGSSTTSWTPRERR